MDSECSRLDLKIAGTLLVVNSDQKLANGFVKEIDIVLLCFGEVEINSDVGIDSKTIARTQDRSLRQRTSLREKRRTRNEESL